MEKLKWKYDKRFKQWWVNLDYENQFHIEKEIGQYVLYRNSIIRIGRFACLKNAKTVAQLLYNG